MGTIISLSDKKKEREPHMAGEARCIACKHEWVAVSPTGTTWLECPECHAMKGVYIHPCLKIAKEKDEYEPWWTCKCGNNLFIIYHGSIMCPNCGEFQYPEG